MSQTTILFVLIFVLNIFFFLHQIGQHPNNSDLAKENAFILGYEQQEADYKAEFEAILYDIHGDGFRPDLMPPERKPR